MGFYSGAALFLGKDRGPGLFHRKAFRVARHHLFALPAARLCNLPRGDACPHLIHCAAYPCRMGREGFPDAGLIDP